MPSEESMRLRTHSCSHQFSIQQMTLRNGLSDIKRSALEETQKQCRWLFKWLMDVTRLAAFLWVCLKDFLYNCSYASSRDRQWSSLKQKHNLKHPKQLVEIVTVSEELTYLAESKQVWALQTGPRSETKLGVYWVLSLLIFFLLFRTCISSLASSWQGMKSFMIGNLTCWEIQCKIAFSPDICNIGN